MNITINHPSLIITLDDDAPLVVKQAWVKFLLTFKQDNFFESVLDYVKDSKNMILLKRDDGGLGDTQENEGRQIRSGGQSKNDLIFHFSDKYVTWTNKQAHDISKAIKKAINVKLSLDTTFMNNGISFHYRVDRLI